MAPIKAPLTAIFPAEESVEVASAAKAKVDISDQHRFSRRYSPSDASDEVADAKAKANERIEIANSAQTYQGLR